jgi:hypothetical protein
VPRKIKRRIFIVSGSSKKLITRHSFACLC